MENSNSDCNRGAWQPPAPRTNPRRFGDPSSENFIHPLQGYADVPSGSQEFIGGPSTSVETLISACGDGNSVNISKCRSKTCILNKKYFKPSDSIISTVTHRIYSCTNKDAYPAHCNSSNVIYLITCSTCKLQYVGETAQKLNIRFAKHRECMKGNVKSNSCKRISDHFSSGLCKGSDYTVQIIE